MSVDGSNILDLLQSKPNGDDVYSLDDLAWVDSCFTENSETSESDWDSFKNALDGIGKRDDLGSSNLRRIYDDNVSSDDGEEIKEVSEDDMVLDKIVKSKKTKGVYPFRPNYKEEEKEDTDLGLDLGSFDVEEDPFVEEIFKVWDLDIPAEEEDELVITKQLLTENSLGRLQSSSDNLEDWKDLKEGSIDSLVNGISDLSLG